jgi:hypothetical protein
LKSEIQLADYDDHNRNLESLQAVAPREDGHRSILDATLRETRATLPPTGLAHHVQPPIYALNPNASTAFGHPRVLNSAVAVGAVAGVAMPFFGARFNAPYVF